MDTKKPVSETIISKIERITETAEELLNTQQEQLFQIKAAIPSKQDKLADKLLNLASEMSKNAKQIESYVVEHLLEAPYDAKHAFTIHKAMFAERHEMAMFLYENFEKVKQQVHQRIKNAVATPSEKIKVFTYWDSDNNLPFVVSLCRESLEKHIPQDKFELIILNSENYKDWINFRKSDIQADISQAHFTDILRMKLLEKWGGFWLDATCLLTQDFYQSTQEIRKQEQFLYCYTNSRVGNWFIYSKPNNYVLSMVCEMLISWWNTKGYLTNYFMTHDIIEMMYWIDDEYRQDWDRMLKIHPHNALAILQSYNQFVSTEEFHQLLNSSFIHKLTYKYDSEKIYHDSGLERLLEYKP